jgi:uncharacterized membrane protein YbjE (DUF340 family)
MTKGILISVAAGVLIGYVIHLSGLPVPAFLSLALQWVLAHSGLLMTIGLGILVFFVGVDLGRQGGILSGIRNAGFRVLLIPVGVIAGTLTGGLVSSLFLPYNVAETTAVSAGFAWYSLAPVLISKYSAEVGAVSFVHNILRELSAVLLIPIVAKYIGYLETVAPPGAASMDSLLPIVERATTPHVAVYSFVSGLVITFVVPVLIPILATGFSG